MGLKFKYIRLSRIFRTLVDIGPKRLIRRLRYDLRQRLDQQLPAQFAIALAGCNASMPQWLLVLQSLVGEGSIAPPKSSKPAHTIRFCFINQNRDLSWPINWNDPSWPRLWQFHLHYFDWAREWLEEAHAYGKWPAEAAALEPLLDQWISTNPPGYGDGWHSYTLSLRTRNWIWLFRSCPSLATPARLKSLWQQLCWLQSHPEHCHGGNHWLENLTALAIGGLQFDGPAARAMHRRAIHILRQELPNQLLVDGGHIERSASYHLLMLDRLVEIACCLADVSDERPDWLFRAICAMATWAESIRIEGGKTPRFNDSSVDAAPPLDVVKTFAKACLQQSENKISRTIPIPYWGLRQRLLQAASAQQPLKEATSIPVDHSHQQALTDLHETGWAFLRPGDGWELAFRCGIPCPKYLPPHVHSDQLSIELSHHGRWLFSEAGTSIYTEGSKRSYERSSAAHNVLQLGIPSRSGEINWIEPVEVWGSFRAGRKSSPRHRHCGELSQKGLFTEGSHDGFDRFGASHHRRVELIDPTPQQIKLRVQETVVTKTPLLFRIWWHLAPQISKEWLNPMVLQAPTADHVESNWHTTWFSEGFGQRLPRNSYCVKGSLVPGKHELLTTFSVVSI